MQSCLKANTRCFERQCIWTAFLVWHSQSASNSPTVFIKDSWYFLSTRSLSWNKMLSFEALNALINPTSPNCCLETSNWISFNWIHTFYFLADIKTLDFDTLCLSLFLWSSSSFKMCEIDKLLGICDFAPSLLCETSWCEALWGCLCFCTFDESRL